MLLIDGKRIQCQGHREASSETKQNKTGSFLALKNLPGLCRAQNQNNESST
jgi:hypothetical protein